MASEFVTKEWKQRISEFATRRLLSIVSQTSSGMTVDVERAEGLVSQVGDAFSPENMNGLEQRIADAFANVDVDIEAAKKSASDGKTLIAAAITAKKIAASASDTFAVLAQKIGQIVLGSGNAATADVLAGKTFTNDDGVEYTGTMTNMSGTAARLATASLDAANGRLKMTIPITGYYNTGNFLYAAYSTIASLIGLTAAKLMKGSTILGITGTGPTLATKTVSFQKSTSFEAGGTVIFAAAIRIEMDGETYAEKYGHEFISAATVTYSGTVITVAETRHEGDINGYATFTADIVYAIQ